MKVKELIEGLKTLNPDLEVMIDITTEGDKMFHFIGVSEAEEVTMDDNEKFIVLFTPDTALRFDNLNNN